MHHYVGHTALLPCGYVSPLHMDSLDGLVSGQWLVLSGGAELMGRDIDRCVWCGVLVVHLCRVTYAPGCCSASVPNT
jgi:hypothetical protein